MKLIAIIACIILILWSAFSDTGISFWTKQSLLIDSEMELYRHKCDSIRTSIKYQRNLCD